MRPVAADPDDDALARAQAGDASAFDALVTRYRREIYRVCRGILKNHEKADEACQDAFVKAWQGLAGFQRGSAFKTWMYRIAMNAAHDLRAREATQARVARDAAREPPPPPPRSLRPAEEVMRDQELGLLRECIARLPQRQRETLTLRVQQDLTYAEIAEVLRCPVGTVKANFHHAVQGLRRLLAERGLASPEQRPGAAED